MVLGVKTGLRHLEKNPTTSLVVLLLLMMFLLKRRMLQKNSLCSCFEKYVTFEI